MHSRLKLLLRFLVTAVALFWVYRKIDFQILLHHLNRVDAFGLAVAFVFLNASQVVSAFRFRYYLSTIGYSISWLDALALHYRGLLLNSFLPGGVGGDAYKVIALKKAGPKDLKKLIQVTFSNRASGLVCLLFMALLLVPWSERIQAQVSHAGLLALVIFAGLVIVYSIFARFFLAESVKVQAAASVYSFAVQLFMVCTAAALFSCLQGEAGRVEYLVIFLASSIATALPISIGGLGIRELVLFKGSKLLGIDADLGVILAALFFSVYLLSGGLGVTLFWMKSGVLRGSVRRE